MCVIARSEVPFFLARGNVWFSYLLRAFAVGSDYFLKTGFGYSAEGHAWSCQLLMGANTGCTCGFSWTRFVRLCSFWQKDKAALALGALALSLLVPPRRWLLR